MNKLVNQNKLNGLNKVNTESGFCECCVLGKQTRKPFPVNKNARSNRILCLIHTDVCSMPNRAYDGSKYFVTFTDDFSRASMIYCIERKSDVLQKFKEFVAMAEALHGCRVATLKADNGGEYISKEFNEFCKKAGIQIRFTVPYNPEMNAVAERLNRTLQDKARTMLLSSDLEEKFWSEAIHTANYLKNRSPTSAVGEQFKDKTPADIWFNGKQDISHLRVFGSACYNFIPENKRKKLEARSSKCIMLGYASSIGSYRLWDMERNELVIGRHVKFNEGDILRRAQVIEILDSGADVNKSQNENIKLDADSNDNDSEASNEDFKNDHSAELDGTGDDHINGTNSDGIGNNNIHSVERNGTGNVELRRSERRRKRPDFYGEWDFGTHYALSAEQFVENDPRTMNEAMKREDWPQWKDAVDSEYNALIKNNTWSICELPKNRHAVSCKWVFKLKRNAQGEIDKYKARLVARGFSQREGFDYMETYSPVAKLTTLRILLSVANHMNMFVHQMDVKSAFLNGKLHEEIFMQQPEGFRNGNGVLKLNRAIYGLKQASRVWNESFNDFMVGIGFKRCASDRCLYVKNNNGTLCYVLLYVDDLLIVCKDM